MITSTIKSSTYQYRVSLSSSTSSSSSQQLSEKKLVAMSFKQGILWPGRHKVCHSIPGESGLSKVECGLCDVPLFSHTESSQKRVRLRAAYSLIRIANIICQQTNEYRSVLLLLDLLVPKRSELLRSVGKQSFAFEFDLVKFKDEYDMNFK